MAKATVASIKPRSELTQAQKHAFGIANIEDLDQVHEALLMGLALLGEWQERMNAFEVLELCNMSPPPKLRPIDVFGHAGGASLFAEALIEVARAQVVVRDASNDTARP
jgi:hypothetical protein